MSVPGVRKSAEGHPDSRPAPRARGIQLVISGDCLYKKVSDSMLIRQVLTDLSVRFGVRCLTVTALNLEHEQIRQESPKKYGEMGLAGCAIYPQAIASLRVWPRGRHFEMDVFFTETATPDIVTRWAREALGANTWACEVFER